MLMVDCNSYTLLEARIVIKGLENYGLQFWRRCKSLRMIRVRVMIDQNLDYFAFRTTKKCMVHLQIVGDKIDFLVGRVAGASTVFFFFKPAVGDEVSYVFDQRLILEVKQDSLRQEKPHIQKCHCGHNGEAFGENMVS